MSSTTTTTTTIVLPWSSASELAFVRDSFYPQHSTTTSTTNPQSTFDPYNPPSFPTQSSPPTPTQTLIKSYKQGLTYTSAWTFKSPRSLPHAVTATSMLIEAKLHDLSSSSTNPSNHLSPSALSSIYSQAVMKFVNGFVDKDVTRSLTRTGLSRPPSLPVSIQPSTSVPSASSTNPTPAGGESSMYAHAVTIGMPSSFVDVRHKCVHGSGGGRSVELWVLRRTCDEALEWLWERWWVGNATGDAGRWIWEMKRWEGQEEGQGVLEGEDV